MSVRTVGSVAGKFHSGRLLADLPGRVSIVHEGARVFADVEMEAPARLLVAGASLNVVAGAGFEPATFGL